METFPEVQELFLGSWHFSAGQSINKSSQEDHFIEKWLTWSRLIWKWPRFMEFIAVMASVSLLLQSIQKINFIFWKYKFKKSFWILEILQILSIAILIILSKYLSMSDWTDKYNYLFVLYLQYSITVFKFNPFVFIA